jgi:hypothetical protein
MVQFLVCMRFLFPTLYHSDVPPSHFINFAHIPSVRRTQTRFFIIIIFLKMNKKERKELNIVAFIFFSKQMNSSLITVKMYSELCLIFESIEQWGHSLLTSNSLNLFIKTRIQQLLDGRHSWMTFLDVRNLFILSSQRGEILHYEKILAEENFQEFSEIQRDSILLIWWFSSLLFALHLVE